MQYYAIFTIWLLFYKQSEFYSIEVIWAYIYYFPRLAEPYYGNLVNDKSHLLENIDIIVSHTLKIW